MPNRKFADVSRVWRHADEDRDVISVVLWNDGSATTSSIGSGSVSLDKEAVQNLIKFLQGEGW